MPDSKKNLAAYFNFSRKDRIGLLVLSGLILLVLFLPSVLRPVFYKPVKADTSWVGIIRKMEYKQKREPDSSNSDHPLSYQYDRPEKTSTFREAVLFPFDPNTITAEDWAKLGVTARTITTIERYRAKGGQFRKPEDLQRIYGLHPGFMNAWPLMSGLKQEPTK